MPRVLLLHSYTCYIRGWKKFFRRYECGNLQQHSLKSIWLQPDYSNSIALRYLIWLG